MSYRVAPSGRFWNSDTTFIDLSEVVEMWRVEDKGERLWHVRFRGVETKPYKDTPGKDIFAALLAYRAEHS